VVSLGLEAEVQAMAAGAGVPTGMVTFEVQVKSKKKVTEKVLGTGILSGGKATLTVKPKSVLKDPITILYAGDADFVSGEASPTTLTQSGLKSLARPMVTFQARGRAHAELRTHTGRRGRHS
jgi:Bacterial Ig-like domain (group 3)